MRDSSPTGDNGTLRVSPLWGSFQGRSRTLGNSADSRPLGFGLGLIVYVAVLAGAAVAFGVSLAVTGHSHGPVSVVATLALLAAWLERGSVRLTAKLEVSISLLPMLFVAVAFGPLASMLVSAASMLGDLRSPYLRWAAYTSSRSITGGVTGLVAIQASGFSSHQFGSIAVATAAAALCAQALDTAFAVLMTKARRRSALEVAGPAAPVLFVSVPLNTTLIAPLAYAYAELSAWTVLLFLAPALAAQRLYVLYQDQRRLTDDLSSANSRLERASLSFAAALVAALDARDRYTAGHSAAVAIYARDIAARLWLTEEEQQLAHLCGLVHDIGKVGVPPGVLEKRGPLTAQERLQMEEHSTIGERILRNVEDYAEIATIVRHHHERMDGVGYPDRLQGHDIPIISRIIAVADAYNAMTSGRPYREAMPTDVARLRLAQSAGSQFDAAVVAAFDRILATSDETYISGMRADFAVEAQAHPALAGSVEMTAA